MSSYINQLRESHIQPAANHFSIQKKVNTTPFQLQPFQEMADNSSQVKQSLQLQSIADNYTVSQPQSLQKKANHTGLPDGLKSGIEGLSGYSMDDVKVHYGSDKPAQLQAHAYAHGTDIHLGPGQEKHLAHEAWHVVQQKQGRVKPTLQLKGNVNVNDDHTLEQEADLMGAKALQFTSKHTTGQNDLKNTALFPSNLMRKKQLQGNVGVVQLTKLDTTYGEFDYKTYLPNTIKRKNVDIYAWMGIQASEKLDDVEDRESVIGGGCNIILAFKPNEVYTFMKGEKIGLTQTTRATKIKTDKAKELMPRSREHEERQTSDNDPGYYMDRNPNSLNPVFGMKDAEGGDLAKSVPSYESENQIGIFPDQLAQLDDGPSRYKAPGEEIIHEFETTALVLSGFYKDMYLGSVSWGYHLTDKGAECLTPKVISEGKVSKTFLEAVQKWNKQTVRKTKPLGEKMSLTYTANHHQLPDK